MLCFHSANIGCGQRNLSIFHVIQNFCSHSRVIRRAYPTTMLRRSQLRDKVLYLFYFNYLQWIVNTIHTQRIDKKVLSKYKKNITQIALTGYQSMLVVTSGCYYNILVYTFQLL